MASVVINQKIASFFYIYLSARVICMGDHYGTVGYAPPLDQDIANPLDQDIANPLDQDIAK